MKQCKEFVGRVKTTLQNAFDRFRLFKNIQIITNIPYTKILNELPETFKRKDGRSTDIQVECISGGGPGEQPDAQKLI